MEPERRKRSASSGNAHNRKLTLLKSVVSATVGIIISAVLTMHNIDIFKPKTITQNQVERFEPLPFSFGEKKQIGKVVVQQNTTFTSKDNTGNIIISRASPISECNELMVIDFKYPINNNVHNIIKKIPGVLFVRGDEYRAIIDRPCHADDSSKSEWKWEEIWKNVEVELKKFWG